jgi:hypothetical protein
MNRHTGGVAVYFLQGLTALRRLNLQDNARNEKPSQGFI